MFNAKIPSFVNNQVLLIWNKWRSSLVNTNSFIYCFATFEVASWCWETFSSPLVLNWGTFSSPLVFSKGTWSSPPALECRSTRAGTISDLCNMLIVNFLHLSKGGWIAPAGYYKLRCGVHGMAVSAQRRYFCSGTLVVYIIYLKCVRAGCKTFLW